MKQLGLAGHPLPAGWQSVPAGYLFRREKRPNFPGEELLSVYRDYGVVPKNSRDDNFNKASEDLTAYQLVEPNDLVINKMKAWQGSVGVSEHRGIVSPAYFVASPTREFSRRYVHYLLRCSDYLGEYQTRSAGIRVNQWDLDWDDFRRIPVTLPPPDDQDRIANFLDDKTTRIDALISEKGRLVKALVELKRSVIHAIVTGAGRPSAGPSGSKFYAQVPAGWKLGRVKHIATSLDAIRVPLNAEERADRKGPYPYYGASGIIDSVDAFLFDEELVLVGEDGANLVNRSTPLAFVADGKYWVNNHAHILRPTDGLCAFWAYAIDSLDVFDWVTGAAQPKLTIEALMNLPLLLPPMELRSSLQMQALNEDVRIEALKSHVLEHIGRLREYRSSLISAAVTGQLDIGSFDSCAEAPIVAAGGGLSTATAHVFG